VVRLSKITGGKFSFKITGGKPLSTNPQFTSDVKALI
jgi:hypothetical protein